MVSTVLQCPVHLCLSSQGFGQGSTNWFGTAQEEASILAPPYISLASPILLAVLGQQARAAPRFRGSCYDVSIVAILTINSLQPKPGDW